MQKIFASVSLVSETWARFMPNRSREERSPDAGWLRSATGLRVAQTLFGAGSLLQSSELIKSGEVDAVLIATPHYSHAPIGIQALEAGLHVLVEKPLCVHKADCER